MSSSIANLILIIGLIGIGYYVFTGGSGFDIGSIFGLGGGSGGGGPGRAVGKMIYKGTGKVLTGNLAVKDANQSYSMHSGNNRPSTRYIWGSGKGSGAAKCMNFTSYEATVYATYGKGGSSNTRSILTGGGPGQRGNNCCVYSTGFVTSTGKAFAEEEGPHSPKPTIFQMSVQLPNVNGAVDNIGPLAGRTIGLKQVLIRNGQTVRLEGWVDQHNNGNWQLFYRAINPHGGSLPVITKMPMQGENCGEVRFRTDGIWPVTLDTARSFVAELPPNPSPIGNSEPAIPQPIGVTKGSPKTTNKKTTKKSNFSYVYDGNMHYLEQPIISTLWGAY